MKKIVIISILTVLLFISCKKEKTPVNDEIFDEDLVTIDEIADEFQDEFSDPDEITDEADDMADADEDIDEETDEDIIPLLRFYVTTDADGNNSG